MGFELGPGALRRAPRGWLPARALSLEHKVYSHNYGSEGAPEIETTMGLTVTWRIEVDGREPYELREERSGPMWLADTALGGGNRWYKVRLRPQFGLMRGVGVPCFVDPGDRASIWIDWDAGYAQHVIAWEREARIRRDLARREGVLDQAFDRLFNPFAGKLQPGDEEVVEERWAKLRPAKIPDGTPALSSPMMQRIEELKRIHGTGRKTRGTVISRVETDRRFENVPVVVITFSVEGRTLVFEHVFGPRHAKHYKPGREVDMWVDPENPDAICPGR